MNKSAIIGIGIGIIVAAIAGVYAVSIISDDAPSGDASVGLEDQVEATKQEEKPAEVPVDEPKIGIQDSAEGTIEEPEEDPIDSVEATVVEKIGVKQP